jgi:hypothetical protein
MEVMQSIRRRRRRNLGAPFIAALGNYPSPSPQTEW